MHSELKMLHLQLSRKCNLHCRFCGQHHTDPEGAMSLPDWINVLKQLREYAREATVVIWGGEPLAYPHFREIAQFSAKQGFPMEIITNGTMISDYADLLRTLFKTVYISVDGPEKIHDAIRGTGVFSKVKEGLEMFARVCERHTGTGITKEDIIRQNLPLELKDYSPVTLEEKLICYADKFFSKTNLDKARTKEEVVKSMAKFGEESTRRIKALEALFG